MKNVALLILLVSLFTISVASLAQPNGGEFEITKSTIDSGGTLSSGGEFTITGAIGQHDASERSSSGLNFIVDGGFWAKAIDAIFSNGFESEN